MASASTEELQDEDSRAQLQSRLALAFGVFSLVAMFYGASQLALALFVDSASSASQRSRGLFPLTLSIGVGLGLVALRCRRGVRSLLELRTLDAAATAATCWVVALSLSKVPPPNEASVSIALGTAQVLLARAVFLPSSGWRTFWIGVLGLLPAGAVATWLRIEAAGAFERPEEWALQAFLVFRNAAVTALLAAFMSHVLYGLRKQVRDSARLGQYLLHEKIGEGGMGAVYRATHALLRRDTAVKVLLPNRVGKESMMRFEREVQLTARLAHPSTVAVFDYGRTPDGVFYYAMEYLDGGDLEQLVAYAGPLPPARVVWILDQVCRALAEAHALGLIHRDVKPSNVLLCERGGEGDVAKILDFGLVKDLRAGADVAQSHQGTLAGTPLYIAPESISAPSTLDARADLYSLGALAYFLLVGEPVFLGNSILEVCAAHLHTPPPAPSERRPEVNAALDAVILRCLAKQPGERHADALALRAALLDSQPGERWTSADGARWWAAHAKPFAEFCKAARAKRQGATGASFESAMVVDWQARRRPQNASPRLK
jgi:serine/threonine-protein kinase